MTNSQCSHEKNDTTFEHHTQREPAWQVFKIVCEIVWGQYRHTIPRTILKPARKNRKFSSFPLSMMLESSTILLVRALAVIISHFS